jgi:hypothetical protein
MPRYAPCTLCCRSLRDPGFEDRPTCSQRCEDRVSTPTANLAAISSKLGDHKKGGRPRTEIPRFERPRPAPLKEAQA